MAPSPEYDKEPKAPDKSTTTVPFEDTKVQQNFLSDQQTNFDQKAPTTSANTETENNKHVETLDDGQLRALLDEAITYKCPKDREGKSSLFKELLEEVEQDEQACEAAARSLGGCRGSKRGGRSRRALPHSNSLQDLVAALAAEPTRRHHARHAVPTPTPSSVSARAIHGGSLPSGVDTSSLLSEEPARGAGYLATVRCVNPPPLAERRVSASDTNAPHEMELLNRRSKPMFPMTYTARATLEIGSGSVCSGRAVTTTTASNQVRTPPSTLTRKLDIRDRQQQCETNTRHPAPGYIPYVRFPSPNASQPAYNDYRNTYTDQTFPMNALRSKTKYASARESDRGGGGVEDHRSNEFIQMSRSKESPRGPRHCTDYYDTKRDPITLKSYNTNLRKKGKVGVDWNLCIWLNSVNQWYRGLEAYSNPLNLFNPSYLNYSHGRFQDKNIENNRQTEDRSDASAYRSSSPKSSYYNATTNRSIYSYSRKKREFDSVYKPRYAQNFSKEVVKSVHDKNKSNVPSQGNTWKSNRVHNDDITMDTLKKDSHLRVESELVPRLSSVNPRNIRNTSIGEPPSVYDKLDGIVKISDSASAKSDINNVPNVPLVNSNISNKQMNKKEEASHAADMHNIFETAINESAESDDNILHISNNPFLTTSDNTSAKEKKYVFETKVNMEEDSLAGMITEGDIELIDIPAKVDDTSNSFSQYIADQQKLFQALQATNIRSMGENAYSIFDANNSNRIYEASLDAVRESKKPMRKICVNEIEQAFGMESENDEEIKCTRCRGKIVNSPIDDCEESSNSLVEYDANVGELISSMRYVLAELPNNAYIVLTLSKRLVSLGGSHDIQHSVQIEEIESNNNEELFLPENNVRTKAKKKKDKSLAHSGSSNKRKDNNAISKNTLKALLFENLVKDDRNDKQKTSAKPEMQPYTDNEVDSAIPFSCITTPEVVTSCNTTSCTSLAAVAVDPKPLQLGSCYRAVASVTGELDEPAEHCALVPAPQLASALLPMSAAVQPALDASPAEQSRSVVTSNYNGLPLSRPNYGSTGSTAPDEYKKSIDENGNALQGYSSPLAGSSQHKKPRRKKSSKNETVIDCRQIDGYQGDKDVNELLRFIESNAESARAPKLGRVKHRDDTEDKSSKKRSSERRKDKDKVKRASSLEELSRTTLEELTGPQQELASVKPERRSWGDARNAPAHGAADPPEPTTELTEFQTVTKKRKQRRRTDESGARRSRVPSLPSPPSPPAAHASDRSNDSNDDLDSVHSLPPTTTSLASLTSYADIARTRHNNIPDLIESCNFYAEGEEELEGELETIRPTELQPQPPPPPPLPPPLPDSVGYPALETPAVQVGTKRARVIVKQAPPVSVRRDRKERPPHADSKAVECPAPDVVADRRPPVILLDSTTRPCDMDGVTFGFDINEQLLVGVGRRPRCDLVRDAIEGDAHAPAAVSMRVGCAPLRYVAPEAPPDTRHLHQIIEYVGSAWEDVIRCGSGKIRYFSE